MKMKMRKGEGIKVGMRRRIGVGDGKSVAAGGGREGTDPEGNKFAGGRAIRAGE